MSHPATETRYLTASYDYDLPHELIAQHPAQQRDQSRLLVLDGQHTEHAHFADLPRYLRPGDLLVANDTRVLRARFRPKRRGGGKAEVLLLHPAIADRPSAARADDVDVLWEALVRPGARVRVGDTLTLSSSAAIEIVGRTPLGTRIVAFRGVSAHDAMAQFGLVPLPPYITMPPADADERYQTVYAAHDGSVAAPTAGLHFTAEVLAALRARGVDWATLTLDVGAGTFRPVKSEDIREHPMHAERYTIPAQTAAAIGRARAAGGRVIAVGTTSMRSLEDAARHDPTGQLEAATRWTNVFIYPGFEFRVVDALITNFHLPRSTLLMLASAFAGTDRLLAAYAEAVRMQYRFYSFGDAMFIGAPWVQSE